MVKSKTVALLVLVIIMFGAVYATSAPVVVSPGAPVGLYGFLNSLCGTIVVFGDPVPGSPGSGGD